MPAIKSIVLMVLMLWLSSGYALNQATLKIDTYTAQNWHLEGIKIDLDDIQKPAQKLVLTVARLKLPKPLDDLQFIHIRCSVFTWQADAISCQQGHADIKSKRWQTPATDFAFTLTKQQRSLTLDHLKLAGGTLRVQTNMHGGNWQLAVDGKNINGKQLTAYLPTLPVKINEGQTDFTLTASGIDTDVKQLQLNMQLAQASFKSNDSQFSADQLNVTQQLTATQHRGIWQWQHHAKLQHGVLYADPIHFEVGTQPIIADTQGVWDAKRNHITVQSVTLKNLKVAKSDIVVQASMQNNRWQVDAEGKNINSEQLKHHFPTLPLQFKEGRADIKVTANGMASDVLGVKAKINLADVTVQNANGQIATEKLALSSQLSGQNNHGVWQWQNHTQLQHGALYIEPIYLEASNKPLILESHGVWNAKDKVVTIDALNYQHPETAVLTGTGLIRYGQKVSIEKAELDVTSLNLQSLFNTYIKPYFDPARVEGVSLQGNTYGHFTLTQHVLSDAAIHFNDLTVKDTGHRLRIRQGSGTVNWSNNPLSNKLTQIAWQRLSLFNLPIGAAQVELSGWSNNFRLTKPAKLPFLGGFITANQLSWYTKPQEEPDIAFVGRIDNVSLEKLSRVLNWTPLSGRISGHIPGVNYYDKTLHLGGELSVNVFGGLIKLTNLASVGLFSDYPVIYSDFVLDNLDLDQITHKFSFGNITGKLSGYVKKLVLENWQPTHFFAWFGTPEEDDSSHRISQKAVNNIANIGGGGATDILSRSFLTLFDTFGYDKIGIGCYLSNGVCQMMGVEAKAEGYALITGGGLPRIDVVGYNARVDWPVLVERLRRISKTDDVIIQ